MYDSRAIQLKRDQIAVLIAKDFKLKYDSTALGFLWSLILPTLMSVVYYFVFGVLMRMRGENFMLYLVSGTFLWQFFANVVNQDGGVLQRNGDLLKKTAFDRQLLVWSTFFTEGAHFLLTIPILTAVMCCMGVVPNWWMPVNVLAAIVLVAFISTGVGYFYAAVSLQLPDLNRIMQVFMMMWMYCTPIFIPMSIIPGRLMPYYRLNPMVDVLCIWRNAFYAPGFDWHLFVRPAVAAVVLFVLGRAIFRKLEPRSAEMM